MLSYISFEFLPDEHHGFLFFFFLYLTYPTVPRFKTIIFSHRLTLYTGSQQVVRALTIHTLCPINSTACSHPCCAISSCYLSSLRGLQLLLFFQHGLTLSRELLVGTNPAKCPPVPRRDAAPGSQRKVRYVKERRYVKKACSRWGSERTLSSRGCVEGLDPHCYNQGRSTGRQACQTILRRWKTQRIQDTPSTPKQKSNTTRVLQGDGTFHPARGSGREMETRRWKGSPTLEGFQSLAHGWEASGLLCACPTKTNPLLASSSSCDRGEKETEEIYTVSLPSVCLWWLFSALYSVGYQDVGQSVSEKKNHCRTPFSNNHMDSSSKL